MGYNRASGKSSGDTWGVGEVLYSSQMNEIEDELELKLIDPTITGDTTIDGYITWNDDNWPLLTERTVAYDIPLNPCANASDRWSFDYITNRVWTNSDTTSAGQLVFQFTLPHKGDITFIEVYMHGDGGTGGSHGDLPATLPTFSLYHSPTNGSGPAVELASDTAVDNLGIYDSAFTLSDTVTFDSDGNIQQRFLLVVTGESGANAQNNSLVLFGARVYTNITALKV